MLFSIMNKYLEIQKEYNRIKTQHFFENVLFSNQWWILLTISVALWVIWLFLVDKNRINTIIIVGLLTSTLAIILDDIGLSLALWSYPYNVVPFTSRLYPVNIAIIPVFYMLLYQYAVTWKSYLITLFGLSLFAVFIAEPFFTAFNMYILFRWEHWYSGPIYIVIGIAVKIVTDKIGNKE